MNDSTEGAWDRLEFSFDDLIEDLMAEKEMATATTNSLPIVTNEESAKIASWVTQVDDEPMSRTQFLLARWYSRRLKVREKNNYYASLAPLPDDDDVEDKAPAEQRGHLPLASQVPNQMDASNQLKKDIRPMISSKPLDPIKETFSSPQAHISDHKKPTKSFKRQKSSKKPFNGVEGVKLVQTTSRELSVSDKMSTVNLGGGNVPCTNPPKTLRQESTIPRVVPISMRQRQKARQLAKRSSGSAVRITFVTNGVSLDSDTSPVDRREMRSPPNTMEAHDKIDNGRRDELLELSYTLTSAEDEMVEKNVSRGTEDSLRSTTAVVNVVANESCDSQTTAPMHNRSPQGYSATKSPVPPHAKNASANAPVASYSAVDVTNEAAADSTLSNHPPSRSDAHHYQQNPLSGLKAKMKVPVPGLSSSPCNLPSSIKDVTDSLAQFTVSAATANEVLDSLLVHPTRWFSSLSEAYQAHQSQTAPATPDYIVPPAFADVPDFDAHFELKEEQPCEENAPNCDVHPELKEEHPYKENAKAENDGVLTPPGKNEVSQDQISPDDIWALDASNHFIDDSEFSRDINWGSVVDFFVLQDGDEFTFDSPPAKKEPLSPTETTANESYSPNSSGQPVVDYNQPEADQWEAFGSKNYFDSDLNSVAATAGFAMFENLADNNLSPFNDHIDPERAEDPSPVKAKDLNSLFFKRFEASFDSKDGDRSWKTPPFLFEV